MGNINIRRQEAAVIQNTVINNSEEIRQIEKALTAIKDELTKIDLPKGVDRQQYIKTVGQLLESVPESSKDSGTVKKKIEKLNDYLTLFEKPLATIKTVSPYIKKIAQIFGFSGWIGF